MTCGEESGIGVGFSLKNLVSHARTNQSSNDLSLAVWTIHFQQLAVSLSNTLKHAFRHHCVLTCPV
jgi:hypothetical protein